MGDGSGPPSGRPGHTSGQGAPEPFPPSLLVDSLPFLLTTVSILYVGTDGVITLG